MGNCQAKAEEKMGIQRSKQAQKILLPGGIYLAKKTCNSIWMTSVGNQGMNPGTTEDR